MTELEQRVEEVERQMRDLIVIVSGLLLSEAGGTSVRERESLSAALKAYVDDASNENYGGVLEEFGRLLRRE